MSTKQVKEHMDKAYSWLSKIPVSGEAVDAMIEGCVLELDLQTGKKQDK